MQIELALTVELDPAADDIEAAFANASTIIFRGNAGWLPTYLQHHQLRPTLVRCGFTTEPRCCQH